MSNTEITLVVEKRDVVRKGLNKFRNDGSVPAVLHDHGNPSKNLMADYRELVKVYKEAGKHHTVILADGAKKEMAIIKDVHFNPVKHRIAHVVFQAVRQDEAIETEIPLELVGEVPAEKAGLMVLNGISHVVVQALPKDLPNSLEVDMTGMAEIGDKVTVADIKVPTGVEIVTDPESVIASVEETKAQLSEESAEEEAAAEGEEAAAEDSAEAKPESGEEE
jgi:large subunit ribosomal protein L25